jgi:hypothetical protein
MDLISNKRLNINGKLIINQSNQMANKYKAKRTTIDGITFHSKRESERYQALKVLLKAGEISDLRLQVPFPIIVNKNKVCTYYADFVYFDISASEVIVEDVKGMKTPIYNLKKKLVKAIYNINIKEV